jgi:formate-dependent nitrite reductase membrane component NrfD
MSELTFNWMVVFYFFLGGLSMGSYFLSVAANYWLKEFKPLARTAAIITPFAVALGSLILLIDLGQPLRMWRLFSTLNPTAPLSWGSWILIIFLALSALYAVLLIKGEDAKAKKVAYTGLPFALAVGTYTALALAAAPGRELWQTAILPWLFLNGGFISGLALVMLLSVGSQKRAVVSKLGKFVAVLAMVELAMLFTEIIVLSTGTSEAVMSVRILLAGELSFLFWAVVVVLGALVPIFVLFQAKLANMVYANAVASALLLTGVYATRYVLVIGQQIIN